MNHDLGELNKFIESQKLNDSILASILKKIITDYPKETLRQHAIRATIMFFEEKYKNEYEARYNEQLKRKKELSKNKYSADIDEDMRRSFSLPETLVARIESLLNQLKLLGKLSANEPSFMSDESIKEHKEDEWFANEFPRYTIPHEF
ncbi:MAG: hypothetical protein AABW93_03125 [Nanoarchaeota archaeon]